MEEEGWQRHGAKVKWVKCEKLQVNVAEGGVRCFVTSVVTCGSSAANLIQHGTSLYMIQPEGV